MGKTTISWTWYVDGRGQLVRGYTFNPWWGCIRVSEECQECYADRQARRYGFSGHNKPALWGPEKTTPRRLFGEEHWQEPLGWDAEAAAASERRRVFCASFADVFERHHMVEAARQRLWKLIGCTPHLIWLLLTKRPENVAEMLPPEWLVQPRENVWLGTSVGLQRWLEPRWFALSAVPAVVHFMSAEPLLGPLDLAPVLCPLSSTNATATTADSNTCTRLDLRPKVDHWLRPDWIITGGESGGPPERRLVEPCPKSIRSQGVGEERIACPDCVGTGWKPKAEGLQWIRHLRDQSNAYGIPFHFKQWGGPYDHAAGRQLDSATWQESPIPITTADALQRSQLVQQFRVRAYARP